MPAHLAGYAVQRFAAGVPDIRIRQMQPRQSRPISAGVIIPILVIQRPEILVEAA